MNKISRRKFLGIGGAGLAAAALAACAPPAILPIPTSSTSGLDDGPAPTTPPQKAPTTTPATTASAAAADVEIALSAIPATVPIFSGQPTQVWQFQGEVLKGDAASLQSLPDTYLGPIFRLNKGQRLRVNLTSQIPRETIVHWHGLHVPAEMDGHPRHAINQGERYDYEFEVLNRAGTYWYHPHPHGLTGPQVYAGMAGFFLVSDEEERAAGLPGGEFDIPLVIQDRLFNSDNQLVYLSNGMMDQMDGFLGDQILVNGQPDFTLPVATRPYRLRLLNGSNSRIYKLGWNDSAPLTVIGNDGGLLETPVQKPYVTLAPGERVELWADFSDRAVGSEMVLQNQPFIAPTGTMGGGMMGGGMMREGSAALPLGERYPILTVRVERQSDERSPLPERLSTIERISPQDAAQTRRVALRMQPPRGWTLNGRSFEMTAVAPDEQVRLGSTEIWEFVNEGGGMMGGMMGMLPHPMHMHGEQFQVLERQVDRSGRAAWESLSAGFVDGGWKDTVLVMPGERVKVIRRFDDFTGLFLYHCHNLEHEDMGMMRNFEVVSSA
ncbi:MAG: multicopper oxidase domain-containing protein [Caldilineales bacterium]|nr:multicopper oxidase domain-containing protein [Caldilineales bacterium]